MTALYRALVAIAITASMLPLAGADGPRTETHSYAGCCLAISLDVLPDEMSVALTIDDLSGVVYATYTFVHGTWALGWGTFCGNAELVIPEGADGIFVHLGDARYVLDCGAPATATLGSVSASFA